MELFLILLMLEFSQLLTLSLPILTDIASELFVTLSLQLHFLIVDCLAASGLKESIFYRFAIITNT